MNITKIKLLCVEFRTAILKCHPEEFPKYMSLKRFPIGACGDTCILLGRFLNENDFLYVDYVCGGKTVKGELATHAWLEIENVTIDITADQFEDINETVIVTKDRTWYEQYREINRFRIGEMSFNEQAKERFNKTYELILSKL